ncbi:MAG TPA: PIN domain-containing protein [Dehalococcoidia bacterium]|nr:PIN domain-containing protein [Dehalococcoidia bacterium]
MPETLRALDANVVLRYLLNDVPTQAAKARRLIDSDEPLGLTAVVLAEVAWTLTGPTYRRSRAAVAGSLIKLLSRENFVALGFDKTEGQAALLACAAPTGAADFGDPLIAACARSAGVPEIYSFDQRFAWTGLIPSTPP